MNGAEPGGRQRQRHDDRGFTLIELLIALVLSSLIVGVVTAASDHVAQRGQFDHRPDRRLDRRRLISSFLIRDAQSAGATDPLTALRDTRSA